MDRDEPIVAIGGGALGDAAGFLAATYLRGALIWDGSNVLARPGTGRFVRRQSHA